MIIKDSKTLRALTGTWHGNNDFDLIQTDIELETEELIKIVGDSVVSKALQVADMKDVSTKDLQYLKVVQLPIAYMAVFRYFQSKVVSHDDSSRKITIDEKNQKLAWEWMLDRDDAAHLSKAQRATDRLISYLDRENPEEWKNSPNKEASRKLFVNNTEVFGQYYPIENSARFYYLAVPLVNELQNFGLKRALGNDYKPLLTNFQQDDLSEYQEELLDLTRRAQVLSTLALAVRRLNLQALPDGIVKALKSEGQTVNATRPASIEEINYFSKRLEQDAATFIDEIRRKRSEQDPTSGDYQLLPKNDPDQKFART